VRAPYPTSHAVWRRGESSFVGEDSFEDLSFGDFVSIGRRVAMRQQDYLTGNEDQVGILRRGILLTDVDMADLSVQRSVEYTGMVGTMLAESHAAQDTEVGDCDVE